MILREHEYRVAQPFTKEYPGRVYNRLGKKHVDEAEFQKDRFLPQYQEIGNSWVEIKTKTEAQREEDQ